MQVPDKPDNEAQRLNALEQLDILDTDSEERFDRVTRLARRLFDVPIAVVSLVDSDRQWFKSCYGIDAQETPRDVSFCGHAILGTDPFIISDATKDERFADNPLVVGEPGVRFYAGVPLVHHDDSMLGTLCVIDTKPRQFNQEQVNDLVDLAKIVEQELATRVTATTDPLTQISNRRGFSSLGEKLLDYCRFGGLPVSLAYFDLDNFKQLNDQFGHQVGDEALKQFTRLLQTSFRESDVYARMGGDEFVVLMSGTTEMVAHIAIDRFTQAIEAFNQDPSHVYQLGFSVGIASSKVLNETTLESLLNIADQRMLRVKDTNRG
ncbi:sensor domain-containing diguanylate cyclase [Vibrio tubiashii]|uniref:Sensor domain-containing diguanylate cyclase n=1 Tax=Vibrio tubiashii TaxID=29498 RepID=A0AAE5GNJ5_9VIBR|nr:sensor domain-containing diguanylate cyclase [Vibrio tubiashii]NOI79549.1 sensor domain-containing diguanylate cyclase [Vibrio tubiashii]